MLHFINYKKSYGSFLVLRIDDLSLPPGIFWIKGANGSGKSTLLKTAAGIVDFDGNIGIDGKTNIKKNPLAYRKLVNFAEAEPVYPKFLTGMEMIDLFSAAKGAAKTQYRYYVESMKMDAYINEPLGTYSSGMLKKLSLVLAFVGNPKIILLDEPLITIDIDSLEILYEWIAEKYYNEGVSLFLSSHQRIETRGRFTLREILIDHQTAQYNK